MKKMKFLAIALAAVALPLGFASCGGNEDDEEDLWKGELENPKYESDAVLFNVTDDDSDIASIELTASGDYIVIPCEYDAPAPIMPSMAPALRKTAPKSIFRKSTTSRAGWEFGVFGEYKKLKEGVYELLGYGTLTIVNDSRINLALNNGNELNLNVTREKEMDSDSLNDRMCRSWYVTGVKCRVYDRKDNLIDEYDLSDREIKEEYVEYVVMSKAHTYLSVDWDGEIESYGKWNWVNKDLQIFRYVDAEDGNEEYGDVKVTFNGDRCNFYASYYDGEWNDMDQIVRIEEIVYTKAK